LVLSNHQQHPEDGDGVSPRSVGGTMIHGETSHLKVLGVCYRPKMDKAEDQCML